MRMGLCGNKCAPRDDDDGDGKGNKGKKPTDVGAKPAVSSGKKVVVDIVVDDRSTDYDDYAFGDEGTKSEEYARRRGDRDMTSASSVWPMEKISTIAYENGCRRLRLIHDTWGNIEEYYILDKNKLGQGSFGYVCKAQSREMGVDRAVKSLSKARAKDTRKRYRQEILIMKMTDHPNIIKLFETFEDKAHVFLVMELCTGGDLFHRLTKVGRFKEQETAIIMQQILRPVFYMHEKNICHRDIKPENFLFLTPDPVQSNTLKLIDFGFSCMIKEDQVLTTKLGTPRYSSPQVLAGQYDQSCDVWACGVIMYVLLCGQPPFTGRTDAEVMQAVKRGNYAFQGQIWERTSEEAKDMIRKQLKYQPQERWSAGKALHHVFIMDTAPQASGVAQLLTPSLLMDLRFFCSQSLFRRAALQVVAHQLSQEDITKAFRKAFTALDRRGAGVLTVAELSESTNKDKSVDYIRPELEQVLTELGTEDDGAEIGFTDFLAATLEATHYLQEGPCRAAFRAFDQNGDGRITPEELEAVLFGTGTGMNKDLPKDEPGERLASPRPLKAQQNPQATAITLELFSMADINNDGVIDFEEFHNLLQGDLQAQL